MASIVGCLNGWAHIWSFILLLVDTGQGSLQLMNYEEEHDGH